MSPDSPKHHPGDAMARGGCSEGRLAVLPLVSRGKALRDLADGAAPAMERSLRMSMGTRGTMTTRVGVCHVALSD